MTPLNPIRYAFRHRKTIREMKRKKNMGLKGGGATDIGLASPGLSNIKVRPRGAHERVPAGSPLAGAFVSEKNPLRDVVVPTPFRYSGGVKEGGTAEMNKSHRVAMAQALISELAEAHQRHGDTDGTRRLQAMVARMVAELLFQ